MGEAVRVVLADDEAMIRAGVRAVLSAFPGIEVVGEAADGREAVELARTLQPDVALLDIRMARMDGLTAIAAMRAVAEGTGVIMLTTFCEDDYIARALRDGASGFLLKSGDPYELEAAIRAVADGAAYLSPRAAAARQAVAELTAREREVLALLGAGLSNAEIGSRLHLVEGTVKTYVSTILARLGVRNRVQAAILAFEAGIVDGN